MDHDILSSFDFMEQFPVLHDLVICRNISAHDKKGGNDNGFTNKAEFIRLEGERTTVLLDAVGPACIKYFAAFWKNHQMLHPGFVERRQLKRLGKVNYYFDRESSPRISTPLKESVGKPPHVYPLALTAEESTGTTLSYVPMPFQDHLKVTVDGGKTGSFGLHYWYHCYPAGTKVPAWTEGRDLGDAPRQFLPETAWKPAGAAVHELNNLNIKPGETHDVFRSDRAGTVKCIRMSVPQKDSVLRKLWLKAWWDSDEQPSLECPLSLLFAIENRFPDYPKRKRRIDKNADMKGVIVGQDREGLFFLRLPMPFSKRARIAITNRNEEETTIARVRIESDDQATPGLGSSAGYLRTQFRESHDLTPGRDYLMLQVMGRGKIAGCVLAVEETPENFLEGDERIYVDGSRSPAIIGDATETFFNGSWYFLDRAFACPIHGAPTFRLTTYLDRNLLSDITMYRFHPTEFVPFRSEARFSIQHGGFNEVPGHYRSLVFYYHLPAPSLFQTDYLDMADQEDLSAHGFAGPGPVKMGKRDGFFEGEFNGQDIGTIKRPWWVPPIWWMLYWTFIGGNRREPPPDSPDRVGFSVAEHEAPYEFTARIDPDADAVMLRRVLDQSVHDQKAAVEVDGRPAATWFNTGNNKWKIFAEDDIILDPAATRGKDKITLRIVPQSKIFTAAEYTVFSIKAR
ncbi:MAG TPA: DUF2961 domain-containing protein [bacterium]|nr:DUF2961 domain-containing protein [bacterium]